MGSKQKEQKKKGGEQGKQQQQEEEQQQHGQSSNKKRKEVCPYGNYKAYYGYRIGGGELEEDPRLKVFKKEWFQGKNCLDIGCNSGIMTIQIAKKFCCQSILGVDIDNNRIEDAHWHLRKYQRMENTQKMPGKASKSENTNNSEGNIDGSLCEETKEIPTNSSSEKHLSDIVSFKKEDFVNSRVPPGDFDTIICLSVTKWIQLNWGDDGLLTLFTKIWRLLRPGGTFVLEPQPWKSYEKNYKVSETAKTNYRNIMFRPDLFQDLLLDKIGFRTVENVSTSVSGSKTGFNRPILVFQK